MSEGNGSDPGGLDRAIRCCACVWRTTTKDGALSELVKHAAEKHGIIYTAPPDRWNVMLAEGACARLMQRAAALERRQRQSPVAGLDGMPANHINLEAEMKAFIFEAQGALSILIDLALYQFKGGHTLRPGPERRAMDQEAAGGTAQ